MSIGENIKLERERLGYSQTAFADLAASSKHAQINWEKGKATPNTEVLCVWKEHGADLRFITEGKYTYQEIGERLREERTLRLKQNTKGMAELGGITPELQNDYEMGLKRPPADYLNLIAKAGAETWYILTGERAVDDPLLTPKEQELLNDFRRCPNDAQAAILLMAKNSARPGDEA